MTAPIATGERLSAADRLKSRAHSYRDVDWKSELRVDMRFQRTVDPARVKHLKEHFNAQALGSILVSDFPPAQPGEPPLALIDGQSRVRTLLDLEHEPERLVLLGEVLPRTIHAEIIHGAEPDECALLFLMRNDQKAVSPANRQRVRVTHGDPVMLSVVAQLRDVGYVIYPADEEATPQTVRPKDIKVCEQIVRWGDLDERPTLLTEALMIQVDAFAELSAEVSDLRGTIEPKVLQATAELLRKNPKLDPPALARVMPTPGDVLFDADKLVEGQGMRIRRAVQVVLAARYNKGRKGVDQIKV